MSGYVVYAMLTCEQGCDLSGEGYSGGAVEGSGLSWLGAARRQARRHTNRTRHAADLFVRYRYDLDGDLDSE